MNSYVILGWLSNERGCFSDHLYVELYLAVFSSLFRDSFLHGGTRDLVFMLSGSQARKLSDESRQTKIKQWGGGGRHN